VVISAQDYIAAMKLLDLALLMGSPMFEQKINELIHIVQPHLPNYDEEVEEVEEIDEEASEDIHPHKRQKTSLSDIPLINPEYAIPRIQPPSLDDFFQLYMAAERPVIIMNAMQHWPAMNERSWANIHYLKVFHLSCNQLTYLESCRSSNSANRDWK
jgi:lysine-specific demethylase 8